MTPAEFKAWPILGAIIEQACAAIFGGEIRPLNLTYADLRGAVLWDARLDGASLVRACLDGARLDGARLDGACLDGARLVRARLDAIRDDMYQILDARPNEVAGLLAAVREGRINGSTYSGPCACLVGTIGNLIGCDAHDIPGLTPDEYRMAEIWFLGLRPGQTPENHEISRITERWIVEWQTGRASGTAR